MLESVIVNQWKAEAAVKSKIEAVLGFLEARFGPVPAEAKAKVEAATALDVLQRWVILAAKADSIDTFRREAGL